MQWVTLTVAPDQIAAEIWVQILRDEGIAAMIRPSDVSSYLGLAMMGCRIQVREADLDRARTLLAEIDGAEPADGWQDGT